MSIEVRRADNGFTPFGPGTRFTLASRIMNPQEAHRVFLDVLTQQHFASGGVEVSVIIEVDGIRKPLYLHQFTSDELADAYEEVHHQVHGYDARGLDPREGPTRLRPR